MQGITTAMGKIQNNSEENAPRETRKKTRSGLTKKGLKTNAMPLSNISGNANTTAIQQLKLSCMSPVLLKDAKDQSGVTPVFLENISSWDQWLCRPIHLSQSDTDFVQQVEGTKKSFFCSLCGCQWASHREHTKHLEGVRHKKTYNLYQGLYKFNQHDAATCAMLLNKIREQKDMIQSLGSEAQRREVLARFVRGVHKEKKTVEQSWKSVAKRIQAYKKQHETIMRTAKTEESAMNCGPASDSTLTASTSMVLASDTTGNVIVLLKDKKTIEQEGWKSVAKRIRAYKKQHETIMRTTKTEESTVDCGPTSDSPLTAPTSLVHSSETTGNVIVVHKEKKTIEQSWKSVSKRIQAHNKQQKILRTKKTESNMGFGPRDSTLTASTSTGMVLASETARTVIIDKPTEIGSKSSCHDSDNLLEKSPTETENNADVMGRLDIAVPNDESALQLTLQDISGDYYSDDALDSPTSANIPEEVETFGETTMLSPFSQTQSDVDATCCNLSMLSELSMKSEVNWMDTIPEFEARMQEADFLFSPVKEMNNNDLAILAYNAVTAKGSAVELKSNNNAAEIDMLPEANSLVSSTKVVINDRAILESSVNKEVGPYSAEEVTQNLSDADEIKPNVAATGPDDSMDVMDSGTKDIPFNIVEALDKIHPTSVLVDTLSSNDSELLWLDDDLEKAKECVAALAFFGI